ncbi:MAG TPA: amino acid adenylation domain-containing protein, partial [Thermoanaerobaculia bacterium]|nr:amino acid adenylation domain-containing protein [Thermoanaerobaculia bacterium]
AVATAEEALTYGELHRQAQRLARRLQRLGVHAEARVALLLERSPVRITATLAVLAAGGCYLPLDPASPPARLAFLLEDAKAAVILTETRLAAALPPTALPLLCLGGPEADANETEETEERSAPLPEISPEALAYVMYTSGSTGTPKGVAVPHRGVVRLVREARYAAFGPQEVFLQLAPYAFDASTFELWGALLHGGRLVLPPPGTFSLAELGDLLTQHGITTLWLTAGLFHQMVEGNLPGLAGLRQLLAGGDVLSPTHVRKVLADLPRTQLDIQLGTQLGTQIGTQIINGYGPTESTTFTCCFAVRGPEDLSPSVPLGRPIAETRVHVADRLLAPAPLGVAGELLIGGAGLARGYLDQPDRTAERFVPDPFGGLGERLYRTGDRVRLRPDGRIEFLGRLDTQVKIRGFRVEPGEVEAALAAEPDVREAAVLVRQDKPGERRDCRLVAYVVGDVDAQALRESLRRKLPEPLVPSAIVRLDSLPLNANGKVDRAALPAPEAMPTGEAAGQPLPQGPIEEALGAIWCELLHLSQVGREESFFDIGGHSLLATQVVSRVRSDLGVDLPLRALFECPTVASLAPEVERALHGGEGVSAPPVAPLPSRRERPLSFAQERLWFIDQLEPGSFQYNIPSALELDGPLRPAAFAWALGQVERRHQVLRTVVAIVADTPVQRICPPRDGFPLPLIDLAGLEEGERRERLSHLAESEARRPFDLAEGPVWRAMLLRLADERHVLLFNLHHIAGDGWSTGLMVREVVQLYAAALTGRPAPLPELKVQYADFALWQRQWLSGDHLAAELAWWRETLADAPPLLELPTDRPRPPVQSFRGSNEPFAFPAELARGLRALSLRERATPFMTLLAGWATLLARYSGQRDVSIGTPIAGRNRREWEDLVGCFLNTLVLRVNLKGEPSLRELLGRVRQGVLAAYAHQEVPFEMLVEALQPERTLSHEPLFQVMINLHNLPRAESVLPGLLGRPVPLRQDSAQFDLILTVAELPEDPEGFSGRLEYRTDLVDPATIRRILGHLTTLFAGIVETPERAISELPLLTQEEQRELLAEWNARQDFPAGACLHQLFEEQARRAPKAPAVVLGVESLTYGELDRQADRLARRLRRFGVGPEVIVGICLERSLPMVVAILGVLKAGGAYLPLDPAYPEERLAYLTADAKAPVIVTERRISAALPQEGANLLHLEEAGEWEESEAPFTPAEIAEIGVGPENLAYVIYTSGSTGRPRGVEITHGNVARLLTATAPWFGFGPGDVWTLFHSYAFDFSVWEIWGALAYGGSLVIVPYWVSRSPEAFRELLAQEGVTVLNQTPSAFRQLLRAEEEAGGDAELALRYVIFGGEALELQSLRPWVARHGARRPLLVNMYGITETTVHVTYRPLAQADIAGSGGSVIGRPIPDLSLRVLDAGFEPQPLGVPGELCVAGAGLARGYLGRPELTASRFVPDPWGDNPGARLYRSGDLVRRIPEGDIEYLGRIDHQVKVRGFRIELGEIEAAIAALPGVREVAVIVREDEPGDRRLAAYVVRGPEAAGAGELREALKQKLPEPLLPSAIVELAALPLTVNGKVDRKALPAPEALRETAEAAAFHPPQGAIEEALCGIWQEILRLPQVGRDESFFALGGHSLLATRVISRVRSSFGVELPLKVLFESPTVAALAAEIGRSQGVEEVASPLTRLPRPEKLPLSFAQERLWFIDQLEPGGAQYNMPSALALDGALNPSALAWALGQVERRHEALRTRFAAGPIQVISPPRQPFPLPEIDLSALGERERQETVAELALAEAMRPFDLERGPVWRAALLRLEEERHVLLFTLHHITSDGWSNEVLVREVAHLYGTALGLPGTATAALPELPIQYADFALWQRQWLAGEELERQLAFWRGQLAGAPPLLELPTDRPRPPILTSAGAHLPFELTGDQTRGLEALAQAAGGTLFMVLLAAFQALLGRYSSQEDIVVGTPVAGRNRLETEGLIGFFVNSLAIRARLGGDPTLADLLAQIRETTLAAFAHQDLPFEKLVGDLQVERSRSHSPLFQTVFVLQNAPAPAREIPGLRLSPLAVDNGTAKFDLTAILVPAEGRLQGLVEYNRDLFDRATIERVAQHYRTLLARLVEEPTLRLSELPLLSPAERQQLFVEWNDTGPATAPPGAGTLPELFAAQVARTPEAVAVATAQEALTYGELHRRADRLARRLHRLGVGPEARVALLLERSPLRITATLAVLTAGGCYLPLDPTAPPERLGFLLQDAKASVVLTEASLAALLPSTAVPLLCLDRLEGGASETTEAAGGFASFPEISPEALAYVMYTSGSTGAPKGVAVPHRGVVRLVREAAYAAFGPDEVFLQLAPYAFDASTFELWGALLHGGRLVLPPPGTFSLSELGDLLTRHGITTLWLTAGLFHQMAEENLPGLAGLKQLLAGGDVLSPAHVRKVLEDLPGTQLINGYGPTESTTFTCCFPVSGPEALSPSVPLGRPIAETRVHIADRRLAPAPLGASGELLIGGAGLARGYLDQPDRTAERFVPDPFGGFGQRLYRTGDRVRPRPDGRIEFLGRLDTQVKIRGFRVEPGEVEAVLAAEPGVREAVVLVRQDKPGDRRLVAYVVGDADALTLREALRRRLPEPLVPAAIVHLDSLPLNANGKVDRAALPAPEELEPHGEEPLAPRSPLEEVLAGIWAEVLGRKRVGSEDDFFALGGHSLLATQVISRVRSSLGVDLPLRALFENPTVASFAAALGEVRRGEALAPAPPLTRTASTGEDGPIPLSFAQERLWFIDQLEPGSAQYNIPLALELTGPMQPAALAWALGQVERRQEALRTRFANPAGQPEQRVSPAREPFPLPFVDLGNLGEPAAEQAAYALAGEESLRPFDLAQGPAWRALLLRLAPSRHVLLATVHHIAADGWSMGVLTREMAELYTAAVERRPARLPELPVQYSDYARWQRGWLQGEALAEGLDYWRKRLAGAPPVLELPSDRPRPALRTPRGAERPLDLPDELSESLAALSRRHSATLATALLAAFAALLGRSTQQSDLAIGMPVAGRNRLETEGLIGFFVNTLVLRAEIAPETSFLGLLTQLREALFEAHLHQEIPFEKLVESLEPERSLAYSPLFQVMFTFENTPAANLALPGVSVRSLAFASAIAKFDLSLGLSETPAGLRGGLNYSTELFDAPTIQRLGDHFQALLAAALADPNRSLAELPLLSAAEQHQLQVEWNDSAAPTGDPLATLPRLFADQVARTPDRVAVTYENEALTYAGLERRANRLAHHLRSLGVGPESLVGVAAQRSLAMVVALFGVLKAGGAYVPLDPDHPQERLAWIVEDSGMDALIAEERFADRLPDHRGATLLLRPDGTESAGYPTHPPAIDPLPDSLAYVIYTSGSTGRPKGAMNAHRAILNRLRWVQAHYPLGEEDALLQKTPYTFDVSVWEFFWPTTVGARLEVAVPGGHQDPDYLAATLERAGITVLHFVPSMLSAFLEAPGLSRGRSVRQVVTSGEALSAELAAAFAAKLPWSGLLNLYGPTETAVEVTAWDCRNHPAARPVPLGWPIENLQIHLLDPALAPVGLGIAGELLIAGLGVGRGYTGRPDLTAEKFVPDPFAGLSGGQPGARMYRSGDLARRRPDGAIEYLGRIDHQVKIRGLRIELGEIEAVLTRHPAVREAVVLAREDRPGDLRLVGYVTSAQAPAPSSEELRAFLAEQLPSYMVPAEWVFLRELPVTANGKLDRRALPAPADDGQARQYQAPRGPLEEALARIWEAVLQRERVGATDDFFTLGGHSLLAIQVASRIRTALQVELPLRAFFEASTVERMAALLRDRTEKTAGSAATATAPWSPLVPLRSAGNLPPFFCVHPIGGSVFCYRELAARLGDLGDLGGTQPFYGLEARGLDPSETPDTRIEAMAASYVAAIRTVQPEGPYRLGGWSFGGLVAVEMARQLEQDGQSVDLALIDPTSPGSGEAAELDEISTLLLLAQDLSGLGGGKIQLAPADLAGLPSEARLDLLLTRAQESGALPAGTDPAQLRRLVELFKTNLEAAFAYRAPVLASPIDLWLATEVPNREARLALWQTVAPGRVNPRLLPGDHYALLRSPAVEVLARELAVRYRPTET